MASVYVVKDNNELYPVAYTTYAAAVEAVREKHAEDIEEFTKMLEDEGLPSESEIDVPEDTEKNKTFIFFEMSKSRIEISRLLIVSD